MLEQLQALGWERMYAHCIIGNSYYKKYSKLCIYLVCIDYKTHSIIGISRRKRM